MKLFVFVTFLIMMISFSDESFIDDKSTRQNFYSSYSKYSSKLKEIGLETRIVDLDQIYQIGYHQLQELRDFLHSNSDSIKTLLKSFEKVSLCLEIDLLNALDGHKKISEELWQTLNGIENLFFYEDLIDYFETLKKVKFNELRHNKIYNTADTFYIDKSFDLKKLKLALIDEDDMKFQFEEIVEDYLDEMTANMENKRSLENIQKLSGKFVEIFKEKMKQMVVSLKEYGLLDMEKLLNSTEELKNIENLCQNVVRDLESDVSRLESSILADVVLVDRFLRANIFLVDKDGGKKSLDCDDPVPYYGAKLDEKMISSDVGFDDGSNEEVTFYVRGKDKNGRMYKRKYNFKNIADDIAHVHEIIEYDNETVDKKYIFEFTRTV